MNSENQQFLHQTLLLLKNDTLRASPWAIEAFQVEHTPISLYFGFNHPEKSQTIRLPIFEEISSEKITV